MEKKKELDYLKEWLDKIYNGESYIYDDLSNGCFDEYYDSEEIWFTSDILEIVECYWNKDTSTLTKSTQNLNMILRHLKIDYAIVQYGRDCELVRISKR